MRLLTQQSAAPNAYGALCSSKPVEFWYFAIDLSESWGSGVGELMTLGRNQNLVKTIDIH